MIGNPNYLGKGLGASTLTEFVDFLRQHDPKADTFFIDPDDTNTRAKHVYQKAGFEYVGDFIMEGDNVFNGRKTNLLIKHLS
jgi:RimJ/RimL family protein N-acetyltransferase